ncbi:MAG TPA: sulfite exporter TauE/SafE family protein [Nitrospiraceae bacterium]|nr:sulfite exporter TauE/SafE family protein [Nitrospiraceae bacterium]
MVDAAAQAIDKVTVVTQIFEAAPWTMLGVILLGFLGGTISGFIGSGGAFLMTPGMMNLGIPGVMAVSANITHKFGKAMMGSKKHGELGNVDRKLGIYLLATAAVGINGAVWVNGYFFEKLGKAGSGLYVSAFFVIVLSIVGASLFKDAMRSAKEPGAGPSDKLLKLSKKFQIKPLVQFKVAKVEVSLVVLLVVGLATGYMAGTIGVGGFIGVPAMIYVFGVPTVVAAGTELFLAMFMGAWGAFNYGLQGYVDLRLTLLLYAGSLMGIYFGAVGTKLVKELYIRMVTAILILLCVVSRALAIPGYCKNLNLIDISKENIEMLEMGSKFFLFGSGIVATFLVLFWTFSAKAKEKKSNELGFSHGLK